MAKKEYLVDKKIKGLCASNSEEPHVFIGVGDVCPNTNMSGGTGPFSIKNLHSKGYKDEFLLHKNEKQLKEYYEYGEGLIQRYKENRSVQQLDKEVKGEKWQNKIKKN